MGRAGLFASAGVVLLLAASWANAQEAEEGLRPAVPDDGAFGTDESLVSSTQTPLPENADLPRRRQNSLQSDDRLGLGSATLRLFPALEIGSVTTSNADQARGRAKADAGIRVAPSLRLQSNWARHEWTVNANGELEYFIDSATLATSTADLSSRFRLDIKRTTQAVFDAAISLTEGVGNNADPGMELSAGVALTHDFGGVDGQLRLGGLRVLSGDETGTDFIEPTVALRGRLRTNTSVNPFAEVSYAPRFFDRSGSPRNSHGGAVALGVEFDHAPFITGSLAATYQHRDFEDQDQDSIGAFGVAGSVAWTPTDFTTVTAQSAVDIEEAGTASPARNWTAELGIEHLIKDDFSLFADANLEVEDGDGPVDVTLGSQIGVRWQLNPYLAWSLAYGNEFFIGGGSGDDYDEHRVIASVILRR